MQGTKMKTTVRVLAALVVVALYIRRRWQQYLKWAYDSIPLPAMEDYSEKCSKSRLWYFLGAFALEPHEQIATFERMGKPDYVKGRLMFMPLIMSSNKSDLMIASTMPKATIMETYRPFIGYQSVLFQFGEKATRERQRLNHGFSQEIYQTIHPIMIEAANRLVGRLLDITRTKDHFEVEDILGNYTLEVVSEACFSLKLHEDGNQIYEKPLKTMLLLPGNPLCMLPFGTELVQWWNYDLISTVHRLIRSLIDERLEVRQNAKVTGPARDLLDLLIEACVDEYNKVDHDWIRDQVKVLFIGGSDTTAKTLSWTLTILAAYPDIQEKVRKDVLDCTSTAPSLFEAIRNMSYLDAFLREVLRMYAPVEGVARKLDEGKHEFKGIHINDTKWTSISFYNHFAHRRDDYFPEPNTFRPERWLDGSADRRAFGAFSDGMRACLGRNFALMVMKTTLSIILSGHEITPVKTIEHFPRLGFVGQLAAPVGDYPLRLK